MFAATGNARFKEIFIWPVFYRTRGEWLVPDDELNNMVHVHGAEIERPTNPISFMVLVNEDESKMDLVVRKGTPTEMDFLVLAALTAERDDAIVRAINGEVILAQRREAATIFDGIIHTPQEIQEAQRRHQEAILEADEEGAEPFLQGLDGPDDGRPQDEEIDDAISEMGDLGVPHQQPYHYQFTKLPYLEICRLVQKAKDEGRDLSWFLHQRYHPTDTPMVPLNNVNEDQVLQQRRTDMTVVVGKEQFPLTVSLLPTNVPINIPHHNMTLEFGRFFLLE